MKKVKSIIKKLRKKTGVTTTKSSYQHIRLMAVMAIALFAFGPVSGAVSGQITTWAGEVDLVMTALVGIYSVVGAFLVFVQYMQGSEQAQKNLIKFVIGLAVFGIAKVLSTFFAPAAGGV